MNSSSQASTRAVASVLSPAGRTGRLAVFSYHQVLESRDTLRPGEPNRDDFTNDVELIDRVFTVLPLDEAGQRMADGTLPARAACVTFDDGYANNHEIAAPILEAKGVPATFFVTGGAVDDGIMWNDLVIEAIARAHSELVLNGLPGASERSSPPPKGPALVAATLQQLKYRPLGERRAAAERIFSDNAGGTPPRLMMTRAMVADLARRGFDIGGHTMSHPILKELTDDDARAEIESCSRWIEDVTGRRPTTFAYPNGRPGTDFLPAHMAMVQRAGYSVAVSTTWDVARAGTDRYSVPRIGAWWRQKRSLLGGFLRAYVRSYFR